MKRAAVWFLVLALGFALMLASHFGRPQPPASASQPTTAAADAARVPAGMFFLYLAGMALLMLAGSALLIGLYGSLLAGRAAWSLGSPLVAMFRHKRLLYGLHAAYFGAVILFAAVAYAAPEAQQALLKQIGYAIHSGKGPLGMAGKAYLSRNVATAALVTVAINFLLGSLLSITVPSAILPGVGLLVAAVRAVMWGLMLAPTCGALSRVMLPHSFTLLLEGEAYVLASFFAVLIPIYLFRRQEGPTAGRRYARALMLNLKGNVAVLIVLSAAAVYEAVEVICMLP